MVDDSELSNSDDPVVESVGERFSPAGVTILVEGSLDIGRNTPRLTDSELRKISEQVATKMLAEFKTIIPEPKQEKWKDKIGEIAFQLAVGVAGSALYELLGYLVHQYWYADSPDDALEARKSRRQHAMRRLAQRVPSERREEFEMLAGDPWLQQTIGRGIEKSAGAAEGMQELELLVLSEHSRKYIANPIRASSKNYRVAEMMSWMLYKELQHASANRLGEPDVE